MESFFFVPGTRLHKIPHIQALNVSEIIIDLEDAVKVSERKTIVMQLMKQNFYQNFYIRVPLYDQKGAMDISVVDVLVSCGFKKFVFPKIQKAQDFVEIYSKLKGNNLKIILLVETPRFFLEVKDILFQYPKAFTGIGIGSHDFIAEVGGSHTLGNLELVRQQILYLARAASIQAIDIASMELKEEEVFRNEILDGFEKGYDAKFFIHPWQYKVFKSISLFDQNDYTWAKKVIEFLRTVKRKAEFNPVIIDGQVIERPHLKKAEKIIRYYETK